MFSFHCCSTECRTISLLTYTGVLQRHESLAANLGAKLMGPLLLKSFEKLFDGPIKVIQVSFAITQAPISWLDIVTFARTNLTDFVLSDSGNGKACRIWIKGGQVEISEDDYRLIMSGAPERMIPAQPIPEDESSELETLNILESRLTMLIKKADAVASKARQLNYHLKGRKTAIISRKESVAGVPIEVTLTGESRNFSPQPFSAINNRSPKPPNGETPRLQQELLEQFLSNDRRNSYGARPKPSRVTTSEHGGQHGFSSDGDTRRMSHPITSSEDGMEGQLRVLMATKIEKLGRGDIINPPCDRCRRLKFECTKHLTACSACTKKHAKCSWRDVKDAELEAVSQMPAPRQPSSVDNDFGLLQVESNLDPVLGIRVASAESIGEPGGQGFSQIPHMQGIADINEERRPEIPSNEHAILTQIASAAGAR